MDFIANVVVILITLLVYVGQIFFSKSAPIIGGKPNNRVVMPLSHLYLRPSPVNIPFYRTIDKIPGSAKFKEYDCKLYRHVHWGQLKLLLSEIEFITIALNEYGWDSKPIFIYPGAAPGHHTKLLSSMFPQVTFHLYDEAPFICQPSDRIKIYHQYFLDSDMEYWRNYERNQPILLCSDIRTSPVTDESITENNLLQLKWWQTIQPDLTIYKFRLPYAKGSLKYPEGKMYIQAFPKLMSTECRLYIKKGAKMVDYDFITHKDILAYHNQFLRGNKYYIFPDKQDFDLKRDGVCNCYDCTTFLHIVYEYLKNNPDLTDSSTKNVLNQAKYIQNHCTKGLDLYKLTMNSQQHCKNKK